MLKVKFELFWMNEVLTHDEQFISDCIIRVELENLESRRLKLYSMDCNIM